MYVSFLYAGLFDVRYLKPLRLFARSEVVTAVMMIMMMKTVCFSETVASVNESTRRQNPEDHDQVVCIHSALYAP